VDRDGAYAFSVRLADNGVCTIFQRASAAPRGAISLRA
jgi:hypothetical protein